MRVFSKLNKNLLSVGIVFLLILAVYSGTSAVSILSENDIEECKSILFEVENACYSEEKNQFNNFRPTMDIAVTNGPNIINGFKIAIFGDFGMEQAVIFKTINPEESVILKPFYNEKISGKIKKIEVKPFLNINKNIEYCSIKNGAIFEGHIGDC